MTKMKAVICTAYGSPNVLQVGELTKPTPKENQALIKVHRTAVTASDGVIRGLNVPGSQTFPKKNLMKFAMRLFLGFFKPRNPVLGVVFSGVVEETGANFQAYQKGDEVFGFTGASRGAYAEYKCISSKEVKSGEVFRKPENASHEEAVALLYGGALATHFLSKVTFGPNSKVLIYGASGAIGTMAIQMIKKLGAEITAVCSTKNFDLVLSLGADEVIDYTDSDAADQLKKYDVVFDAVGVQKSSELKMKSKNALLDGGKYVSVDDGFLAIRPNYLKDIKSSYENGDLRAIIDRVYTLDDIVLAHEYLESGHKVGNVLINVAD